METLKPSLLVLGSSNTYTCVILGATNRPTCKWENIYLLNCGELSGYDYVGLGAEIWLKHSWMLSAPLGG